MELEIQTIRSSDGMGRLKDQYDVRVTLEGDFMDLYRKGLQKFYKGILKGKDAPETFLLGLEHNCNLESKIVVADESTKIRACEAEENGDLQRELEDLEARYFIVTRNEWVSSQDRFQFYRGGEETQYKEGTPVERLRQAAFDTRRTGKAKFQFGDLMGYYEPDVEFMYAALNETDQKTARRLETQIRNLRMQVNRHESDDGSIRPRLSIKEADKVAKLFEQQADLIEPHWNRVEADYERQRGKEDDSE